MSYPHTCYFQEVPSTLEQPTDDDLEQTVFRVGSYDIVIRKGHPLCCDELLTCDHESTTTTDRTGILMWPGSTVLAHALLALGGGGVLAGRTVLELGSGTGFCGVVASIFAKEVVVTDQSSEMRDIARLNLKANQRLQWSSRDASMSRCCTTSVLGLAWPGVGYSGSPFDESGHRQFDLLIASDVLYVDEPRCGGLDDADIVSFFEVVHRKLADGGIALVAYANREHRGAQVIEECSVRCGLRCLVLPLPGFIGPDVLHAEGAASLNSVLMFGFVHIRVAATESGGISPDTFCSGALSLLRNMSSLAA